MSWNYRVIREVQTLRDGTEEAEFTVREVYYDEKGEPNGVTVEAIYPYGETLIDLKKCHARIQEAFSKPVLEMSMFDKQAKESRGES